MIEKATLTSLSFKIKLGYGDLVANEITWGEGSIIIEI